MEDGVQSERMAILTIGALPYSNVSVPIMT